MQKRNRRTIRLPGYDYAQSGWYFITICTYKHTMIFGDVVDGEMILNDSGKQANICWVNIPNHFPHVKLDEYVIMPNHVHGILNLCDDNVGVNNVGVQNVRANNVGVQDFEPLRQRNRFQHIIPKSIGSIVRGYKTGVTKWMRNNSEIYQVWQRNYYERVIRDEPELNRIRQYIIDNPLKWGDDKYYKNYI